MSNTETRISYKDICLFIGKPESERLVSALKEIYEKQQPSETAQGIAWEILNGLDVLNDDASKGANW